MIQYNSCPNFSAKKIRELLNDPQIKSNENYERYTNRDYEQLKKSKITTVIKGVERKKMKKRVYRNRQQAYPKT